MLTDEWRIAVVVDLDLPLGHLANTVAAVSIGLGAACPELAGTVLPDAVGRETHASADRPEPALQASPETIRALFMMANPVTERAALVVFPQFARALHRFLDYAAALSMRGLGEEHLDGLGLAGPDKWVRSLTGSLKLLRWPSRASR